MKKTLPLILLCVIIIAAITAITIIVLKWPKTATTNQPQTIIPVSKPKPTPKKWSLLAVGDVMLGRQIDAKIQAKGSDFPFLETASTLKQADITFGNLESPFSEDGAIHSDDTMNLKTTSDNIESLKYAGFNVLNLANNHFDNGGQAGESLTMTILKDNNIGFIGAGNNFQAAHTVFIKTIGNLKIAFLGYTDRDVLSAQAIATNDRPGVAVMDSDQLINDINAAKQQADVIIISMHSGTEYALEPNARQIEFAHTAIDNGADMVIGTHPHVVQTIETYKDKPIFYSLGNFVFDQPWSEATKKGLAIKINFTDTKIDNIEEMPLTIQNLAQPVFDNPN